MKYLFLLLISLNCFASNWMPESLIDSHSNQAFQIQSSCEAVHSKCFDIGDEPEIVTRGFVTVINDWGAESEIEECSSESDCTTKLESKSCLDGLQKFSSNDFTRVYCIQFLGKKIEKNLSGFASYKAVKAQLAVFVTGKNTVKELRECLAGVIDLLVLRNSSKNLNQNQVEQMVQTYGPIMDLLHAVSGHTAKAKIQEVSADGVLVTEGDKIALTQEIDRCLGI